MVSEIKIRKASKKDLKEIAEILRIELSKKPYYEKWNENSSLEKVKSYFKDFLYVAEFEDNIVGFTAFRFYSWDAGFWGWIDELLISNNFRNKGVGDFLLKKAEEVLKQNKVENVSLLFHNGFSKYNLFEKNNFKQGAYVYLVKKLK